MRIPCRLNIETVDETGLWVPADDNSACDQIRLQRRLDWDAAFRELPQIKQLSAGSVVFDVGAFVGDSTQVFLNQGCEVHAFEPRLESFVCLVQNCPEAFCYNLALGDGALRYKLSSEVGNMGGKPLLPGNRYSVPIDALRPDRLDFLKIDAEGSEGMVLRGAQETLRRLHPIIHLEFNPFVLKDFGDSPESIVEFIQSCGYVCFSETYRHSGPHGDHWDCVVT